MKIHLFTDGSSRGNPGNGGYGIVLQLEGKSYLKEFSQGFKFTTNNRMELLAVIIGLEKLKQKPADVTVWSDSKYVVDAVKKGWLFNWEKKNFSKQKNIDLWKRFLIVYRKHYVKLNWIKGHNNHPQNERCDFLATTAADSENLISDIGYERSN